MAKSHSVNKFINQKNKTMTYLNLESYLESLDEQEPVSETRNCPVCNADFDCSSDSPQKYCSIDCEIWDMSHTLKYRFSEINEIGERRCREISTPAEDALFFEIYKEMQKIIDA